MQHAACTPHAYMPSHARCEQCTMEREGVITSEHLASEVGVGRSPLRLRSSNAGVTLGGVGRSTTPGIRRDDRRGCSLSKGRGCVHRHAGGSYYRGSAWAPSHRRGGRAPRRRATAVPLRLKPQFAQAGAVGKILLRYLVNFWVFQNLNILK